MKGKTARSRKESEKHGKDKKTHQPKDSSSKNQNNNNARLNLFANLLTLVLLCCSAGLFYYFLNAYSTETQSIFSGPNSVSKQRAYPEYWDQVDLWRIISKKSDKLLHSEEIEGFEENGNYRSVNVYQKTPKAGPPLERKFVKYGVEQIRYLILEPSVGVQGFSCVTCNTATDGSQKCPHHYQKNSSQIPPCLMEPNQGMVNLAAVISSSFQCKKKNNRSLMFGLGNGAMSGYLDFFFEGPIDVVEINEKLCSQPTLSLLGNFPNSSDSQVTLFRDDAHLWSIRNCDSKKNTYDLILSDMAGGDVSPPFMADVKWIESVKCLLKENGLFLANLLGGLNSDANKAKFIISVVDNFVQVFSDYNIYFLETGYFNRILIITKDTLTKKDLKERTRNVQNECGTPPMFRGLDFFHKIDNSSPEARKKWVEPFTQFQTRAAIIKLKKK